MNIIILEGAENVGKTFMASRLARILTGKSRIIHYGRHCEPYLEMTAFYLAPILEAFADDIDTAILDRSWLTERVYSEVLIRTERLSFYEYKVIEQVVKMLSMRSHVLFINPPTNVVRAQFEVVGDDYIKNFETNSALQNAYIELMPHITSLQVVEMDKQYDTDSELVAKLIKEGVICH